MSDMAIGLFEDEVLPTEEEIEEFRYEVLDTDDREFVQEKEYEIRTHWTRAASEIMASGEKLLLVQDRLKKANKGRHGSFTGWLRKVGLSDGNAFFSMKAYTRFGKRENFAVQSFSAAAFHALTYASDEVVDQVISGEILPTRNTIREAERKQKEAEEKEKQARQAEAKAKADAQATQQELLLFKATSQYEIDELTRQMGALKREMEKATTPQIEIREITKEVASPSLTMRLETLQKRISELNTQLEAEKKATPATAQKQLEKLQEQVNQLTEVRNAQAQRLEKMQKDMQTAVLKKESSDNDDRIRQSWRLITSEVHACLMRLLGQWPTPIDVRSFDEDEWDRLTHLQSTIRRILDECESLHVASTPTGPRAIRSLRPTNPETINQ